MNLNLQHLYFLLKFSLKQYLPGRLRQFGVCFGSVYRGSVTKQKLLTGRMYKLRVEHVPRRHEGYYFILSFSV